MSYSMMPPYILRNIIDNGSGQQMVVGDGDGKIFNRFTIALDVAAHELTHGVTKNAAGLMYFQQSGALNESISDVFGSLVKQFHLQQTANQADWIIGEGLLTKGIKGCGLRSMSAPGTAYDDPLPGKDPQPADMDHHIDTHDDNGGVHLNSGIPNHSFYLLPPQPWAVLRGREQVRHGMTHYVIRPCRKTPTSALLPDLLYNTVKNALTVPWRKRFRLCGVRWVCREY